MLQGTGGYIVKVSSVLGSSFQRYIGKEENLLCE